jgi:hypothetical protein
MASISIVVTDSINGIISNSYNFTDKEIKRISEALSIIYKGQIVEIPTNKDVMDEIDVNRALFSLLSKNLIQYLLTTVHDTEIQKIIREAKKSVPALEVREL